MVSIAEDSEEASLMGGHEQPCFGRSHGCEWVNDEPKCPKVKECRAKDVALNGKRDCENCIVRNEFQSHMDGFDPASSEFVVLKRFLRELVAEWCADCKAFGYGKWRRDAQE